MILIFFLLIGCERKDEVREFHERQARKEQPHYSFEKIDSVITGDSRKVYLIRFMDWDDSTIGNFMIDGEVVIDSAILEHTNMDSLINSGR